METNLQDRCLSNTHFCTFKTYPYQKEKKKYSGRLSDTHFILTQYTGKTEDQGHLHIADIPLCLPPPLPSSEFSLHLAHLLWLVLPQLSGIFNTLLSELYYYTSVKTISPKRRRIYRDGKLSFFIDFLHLFHLFFGLHCNINGGKPQDKQC